MELNRGRGKAKGHSRGERKSIIDERDGAEGGVMSRKAGFEGPGRESVNRWGARAKKG